MITVTGTLACVLNCLNASKARSLSREASQLAWYVLSEKIQEEWNLTDKGFGMLLLSLIEFLFHAMKE